MRKPLKIRKIGGALGVTLPKKVLQELDVEEGDHLYSVRTANGVELSRYDPDFEEALEISRKVMRKYPNALKKLAEG